MTPWFLFLILTTSSSVTTRAIDHVDMPDQATCERVRAEIRSTGAIGYCINRERGRQ